jgi:tRNA(fMet)-specific endonuclease VapC
MNGKYLLDTNIIVGLFAKEPKIHTHIAKAEEILIPCIAVGELYYGAWKSKHKEKNLEQLDEFTGSNTILACNTDTAKIYGNIKNQLKEKGLPIPENDIWIAAIARQYTLTLATKDAHFNAIENLKIENW